MAWEEALRVISGPVLANESTKQYTFVTYSAGGFGTSSAAGVADGVLQDNPAVTGYVGLVGIEGVSKVLVGPNGVNDGDDVMVDTNGGATTKTSTNTIVGRALATGVSGDIIPVLLRQLHG